MILFTGRGSSGSWKIRGEQLGRELSAVVQPKATLAQCRAADLIVVVKRIDTQLLESLRRSRKPWVWDLVDFYPQPACAKWNRETAIEWVRRAIRTAKPTAVIWPNWRMRDDCAEVGRQHFVLYHHCRPGVPVVPIRETISRLGYEGSPRYIEQIRDKIEKACGQSGVEFAINPESLASCDAVLAMRSPATSGYVQQHWKSNVKLANAHGSGLPFIGQRECGYTETQTGAEQWISSADEIPEAIEALSRMEVRQTVRLRSLALRYALPQAAGDLRKILDAV